MQQMYKASFAVRPVVWYSRSFDEDRRRTSRRATGMFQPSIKRPSEYKYLVIPTAARTRSYGRSTLRIPRSSSVRAL
jgi:hypothetical protein